MKNTRVRMTFGHDGIFWSFGRETVLNIGGTLKRSKKITNCWFFIDHEGYKRYADSDYGSLVERFNLTAQNFDFEGRIS